MGYEDAGETPNTQMTVHRYGPTTIIQEVRGLTSKPFSDKFKSGYVIYGSEGFIAEGSLFDPDGKLVQKFESKNGENHFANFIAAVRSRNGDELNAEIEKGHTSTGLCHVVNISHRLGEKAAVADIQSHLSGGEYDDASPRDVHAKWSSTCARTTSISTKTKLTLGPKLAIDAKNEKFVNNAAADALLGREYRKPFVVPSEADL